MVLCSSSINPWSQCSTVYGVHFLQLVTLTVNHQEVGMQIFPPCFAHFPKIWFTLHWKLHFLYTIGQYRSYWLILWLIRLSFGLTTSLQSTSLTVRRCATSEVRAGANQREQTGKCWQPDVAFFMSRSLSGFVSSLEALLTNDAQCLWGHLYTFIAVNESFVVLPSGCIGEFFFFFVFFGLCPLIGYFLITVCSVATNWKTAGPIYSILWTASA